MSIAPEFSTDPEDYIEDGKDLHILDLERRVGDLSKALESEKQHSAGLEVTLGEVRTLLDKIDLKEVPEDIVGKIYEAIRQIGISAIEEVNTNNSQ